MLGTNSTSQIAISKNNMFKKGTICFLCCLIIYSGQYWGSGVDDNNNKTIQLAELASTSSDQNFNVNLSDDDIANIGDGSKQVKGFGRDGNHLVIAVSYTHLTLPTICSV